jgi:hypothetical protein
MSVMDALEAIYKADPKTAESMIDDIVLDSLADDALDNADLLNKSAAAFVSQRVMVAKRALLRQYAADAAEGRYPDDDVHKAAEWLAGIEAFTLASLVSTRSGVSKAGDTAIWDQQDEQKHRRDARGRFSRGVNQAARRDPTQYQNMQQVASPLRNKINQPPGGGRQLMPGTDEDKAQRTQAQYEQADQILREFGSAFGSGERKNINAMIQYQSQDGDIKTLVAPLSDAAHGMPDSAYDTAGGIGINDTIISIEIDPKDSADDDLREKVARFNTLGSMGGQHLAALGSLDEGKRSALTNALMPRGPEQGKLASLFGRFQSGADVLDATGHDKMGAMARFAGTYGPEAEKVLDPRVRQTAYRYRGTEKEPDILLMRQMNSPQMNHVEAAAREGGHGVVSDTIMAGGNRPGATPPVEGSVRHNIERANREGEPLTEDQLNMRVRSDVAAMHLMKTIPMDRMIGELSQKAGAILPSQGVLIDADGDVVSQAVGVGDDTYLPFDFTNMKRSMRGGQYVRTRQQGGLTGEDIAAAVGNGARMATVVSSSGVHSIEFDPNLRGARGGSDKARSMYRRYLQILDAVENSGMYTQDIDPREKAKLRSQAAEITGSREGEAFKNTYKKLEADARASASDLSEEEMDGLMTQAEKLVAEEGGARNLSPERLKRRTDDVYSELEAKATSEKASKLRLNAQGYQVALETLQQQFPYFIRNVSYEPLAGKGGDPGFLDSRGQQGTSGALRQRLGATDQGYMRPGGIRASSVRGGFYATDKPKMGAEGTTGMKEAVRGERFNEEQEAKKPKEGAPGATPGASGPPGEPGAPGGAPGLNGPTGGPQGGLAQSVARLAGVASLERDQSMNELSRVFSTLGAHRVTNAQSDKSWDEVKDQDNRSIATWVFNQQSPKAALTDPDKSGKVASALADRKAVVGAFKDALQGGAGQQDFFAGGNDFSGHKTPEEAANWVADMALKVVDADLVTQPFVNPVGEKGDPYHVGTSPQALTINGTPINSITNKQQLNSFMARNKDVAVLARTLGTTEGGDDYKPASAVGQEVSERIKVLRNLDRVLSVASADKAVQQGMPNHIGLFLTDAGIPGPEQPKFIEALTRMNDGEPVANAKDLAALNKKWPNREAEAMKLQQAWALVNAGRTVAMIEGPGGVGGAPKVPGRQQGDLWVPKEETAKAASTRLASIVRKSRDSSPLAQEISRRRLAGMQFIPTRV